MYELMSDEEEDVLVRIIRRRRREFEEFGIDFDEVKSDDVFEEEEGKRFVK